MKKVISALTAATMVASMSASVMSAFAVYSPSDIAFTLKANPNSYYTAAGKQAQTAKFTVSEDGGTITFASAADAAGAKIGVGAYLGMPTANPTIQQILGMVKTNSSSVHFNENEWATLNNSVAGDTEATYTTGSGLTFTASQFINTFGIYDPDFDEEYIDNVGQMTQSTLNPSQITDGTEAYTWMWITDLGIDPETAHFLGATSDAYPLTEFTITLDDAIKDGTYTLEWDTTYTNDYGAADATFVSDGKNQVVPGTFNGLKIVVGSAETPTEAAPTEVATEAKPTEAAPTEAKPTEAKPTEAKPTEAQQPTEKTEFKPDGYTWKVDDVTFDPSKDTSIKLPVLVYNDPGTFGVQFRLLIDGKTFDDPTCAFTCKRIANGKGYSRVMSVTAKTDNGFAALAIQGTDTEGDDKCADGGSAIVYTLAPKDGVEYKAGTKYTVSFDKTENDTYWLKFANFAEQSLDVTLADGSITIPGGEDPTEAAPTEAKPTEAAPTEAEPTEAAPTEAKPTEAQPVGDYLYGDVNKNKKVELVDIVMLNRFLTKYDNQTLDAYQVEVANCAGNKNPGSSKESDLNGDDSIEILKYLIGLVASLPSKS